MIFRNEIEENRYEKFNEQYGCTLQSMHWAKVKSNWDVKRYVLEDDNKEIVASAQALIKRLPLGYSMYYIPRGPITKEKEDTSNAIDLLQYIKADAKKDKAIFIKFDPYIIDNTFTIKQGRPDTHNDKAVSAFTTCANAIHKGYTLKMGETVQPRTTMGTDIDCDFRKNYHRSIKRNIKTANKNNLICDLFTNPTDQQLDEFVRLIKCTEEKQGVSLRDKSYFRRVLDSFDNSFITMCKTEDGVYVSGMLCIPYNNKLDMLYMGNDTAYRKSGASALLYDFTFDYAKSIGITFCDISGVEGDLKDGLAEYKNELGAYVKEYIGEFDIPIRKFLYKLIIPIYNRLKL